MKSDELIRHQKRSRTDKLTRESKVSCNAVDLTPQYTVEPPNGNVSSIYNYNRTLAWHVRAYRQSRRDNARVSR